MYLIYDNFYYSSALKYKIEYYINNNNFARALSYHYDVSFDNFLSNYYRIDSIMINIESGYESYSLINNLVVNAGYSFH